MYIGLNATDPGNALNGYNRPEEVQVRGSQPGVAQVLPQLSWATVAPEVTAWQLFLPDVAALNHSVTSDPPVRPPLEKVLGLTDQESDALKAVAADYETKNSLLLAAASPLRMEALMQSLETGKVAANLAQRISTLLFAQSRFFE